MYASVNSFAHRFNMYPLLQNIVYFTNSTFVKKTHYPIISICLFIITVVLNSIQYSKNDKKYLQNQIINSDNQLQKKHIDKPKYSNTILYIYDILGINGFMNYTPVYILFFILTYLFLSLVELNIGYFPLLFLLFIDIMFMISWDTYQNSICLDILKTIVSQDNDGYCCGSFILFMALGFVLYLIQKNIKNIYSRIFSILILIGIYFLCLPIELYYTFKKVPDGDSKTCLTYTWHGANYLFGVLCAAVLSN
jgi:hypothetical protein